MSKEIVYWRGGAEVRLTLIQALQGEGFEVTQVANLIELIDTIEQRRPAAVIVDASASEREVSRRIGELTDARKLFSIPFLLIGSKAAQRATLVAKQFVRLKCLDVPFKIADVFSSLQNLLGVVSGVEGPSTLEPPASQTQGKPSTGAQPELQLVMPAECGATFANANSLLAFNDEELIPSHPKRELVERALDLLAKNDPWLGVSARRTAFVSSVISTQLGLGPERNANIRIVGLLLNWGLLEVAPALARRDLLLPIRDSEKAQIIEGLERTAEFFRARLEDELGSRTVSVIGGLFAGSGVSEHKDLIHDAQCTFVTQIADRSCWGNGHWSSRGAYRVIRNLREGEQFPVERAISEALIRVLGEATTSKRTLNDLSLPSLVDHARVRAYQQLVEEANREAERLFGVAQHRKMLLSELAPGMLLARPLLSTDGKLILRANTELDSDLILRLWQLAAIVPLQTPIFVAESPRARR